MRLTLSKLVAAAASLFISLPAIAQTDEILDTPAGWIYRYGASSADITSDINSGFRPFTIKRSAAGQYDVVSIQNSAPYAVSGFSTSNMHYGLTVAGLSSQLSNRRLVSLDCYEASGSTRVNAISVPNTGAGSTGWGLLIDQTRQQIIDWVADTTPALRITDLSIYTVGGQKRYAAVAVNNQGAQSQGWWWYFDKTGAEVAALLEQNGARLIDIEVETAATILTPARFACVMVSQNPGAGWIYPSLTSQQVDEVVNQTAGRITNLHRYTTGSGATRFAVSLVDNANPQTRRMRNYMAAEATTGSYGFKLKEVDGPVLASLNENFVFEPASMLKILHATYAIRQCALGNDSLTSDIYAINRCTTEYANNICPEPPYYCNQGNETLSVSLRGMMRNSHNSRTRDIEDRYGRSTLNNFALFTAGLSNVRINHRLGCLCGNDFNQMTAASGVELYEKIANGTFFNTSWREELFDHMGSLDAWGYGSYGTLSLLINEEAANTNLTTAERNAFRDAVRMANKGGGYGCGGVMYRTDGGWASIPFKYAFLGTWITIPTEYAFTTFVHGGTDPGALIAYPAKEELLREQIRAALLTWDAACVTGFTSQPQSLSVPAGTSATFSVGVANPSAATFQWQRSLNGTFWSNVANFPSVISGATTSTLTFHSPQAGNEASYRCIVTKPCGNSTSIAATLTITQPCDADWCQDGSVGVPDIFCFLSDWFANDSAARNYGGTNGVPAIFAFLSEWFAAGTGPCGQ